MHIIAPELFIISTLLIGAINLIIPFAARDNKRLRNYFMLAINLLFLGNVLLLDYLFLNGIRENFTIANFGKFSLVLHLEPLGMIFLTLLGILWGCALLYTIKFLEINEINNSSRFLFFVNCCVITGSIIALSANLFTMFIGYEILTLCTIPLIAHQSGEKIYNSLFKYLKILLLSSLALFLPAIIIIYAKAGHGNFTPGGLISGNFSDLHATILLLMFVFGIAKAAIYPLHSWLPTAMVASYPVSALLHAVVVVKTGLFCIYKILVYVFGLTYLHSLFSSNNWLVILPMITILYSSMQAIGSNQVKMMLAYSTINQLSIALMSAFLFSQKGIVAAVMHMVSHAFSKICLFYTAGNIYSVKNSYYISELMGINKTMPKTSLFMLIAALSLIGVPPFAGFISKFYIMLAAAEQENLLVMITLGISTLLSAVYMLKMLIFIYRPTSDKFILHLKLKPYFDEDPKNKSSERIISGKHKAEKRLPAFMLSSIGLCMIGVVFFFLVQQGINKFLIFM
jgi:multicomponent Na+:H+ antiporter subunit D